MNLKKYYSLLLKKARDRDDVMIEKYRLASGGKNFIFYKLRSKFIGSKDKVMIITAGIHGDEIAGPATVQKRLNDIFDYAHRFDVKLIIYPLINPSGYFAGTRYNIEGTGMNNDFIRYRLADGSLADDLESGKDFEKWHWSSDPSLGLRLPAETKLLHRLLKKDPLKNTVAFLDLHQDFVTPDMAAAAYHYGFGDLRNYAGIIEKIKNLTPILAETSIFAGQQSAMKTDSSGFIVRHDGTLGDLFHRLGAKYSITAETTGKTPLNKAINVNMAWIIGLIDLIIRDNPPYDPDISAQAHILPKRINNESKVHLVYTSSPVLDSQQKFLKNALLKFNAKYPHFKIFNVEKNELDPRHLSASEDERLTKFRRAAKKVDWLQPVYGGTGAVDIARHFNERDLRNIKKSRPIINGFSDTTTLINYFYFKLKLLTFHYSNFQGLFTNQNRKDFFQLIQGELDNLEYWNKDYRWVGKKPESAIQGVAIGGNLSTFRDMLEICRIRVRSWKPFIFFIEDVELDTEDLHRVVIALDRRGIFQSVRAIVMGRFDTVTVARDYKKFNFMFGRNNGQDNPDDVFKYLLSREIKQRKEQGDPLHILKVNNLGHNISGNNMIIPIGAKTIIHTDGKIEFKGPFVR